MAEVSILFKVTMIVLSAIGAAMIAVGVWAIVAPYDFGVLNIPIKSSELAGTSARLAISAGIVTILLSFGSLHDFKDLNKKMHLAAVALVLLLVLALSIAAMSVAIDELSNMDTVKTFIATTGVYMDIDELIQRRRIVAIISGLSSSTHVFGLIVTARELSLLKSQERAVPVTEATRY